MNLDPIDFTREPDVYGPPDATHICFTPQGYIHWKIEKLYGFFEEHFLWDDKSKVWLKMWVVNEHS